MKTRRVHVKKGKSRRFRMKKGGQRNIPTQMGGAPAPAPASYVNYNLDIVSLKTSLDSFGNSVNALNDAIISNVNSSVQHVLTSESEAAAAVSLQQAAASLKIAFLGGQDITDPANPKPVVGLYNTLMKNSGYSYTPWSYTVPSDNTAAYLSAKSLYDTANPTGSPGFGKFPTQAQAGTASALATALGYTGPPLPA